MTKVYTKTGDKGETSLIGGKRVKKSCIEIDAIGEIDELNALIGVLISELPKEGFDNTKVRLSLVQHRLFTIGSNIADVQMKLGNVPKLAHQDIVELENWIDEMETNLVPLKNFILPGGERSAAQAFFARAICRRAERRLVELSEIYEDLDPLLKQFVNRLSDVLFVLGRWINKESEVEDVIWQK